MLTSDVPKPYDALESASIAPRVLTQENLSLEDKMILYAVLQDIANELRSIKRERKNTKHHEEGTTKP